MSWCWQPRDNFVCEVVPFPFAPVRFWQVAQVSRDPELFVGRLAGPMMDEWQDAFTFGGTEVGALHLVMAALQDRRYRQGLPIVVEGRT